MEEITPGVGNRPSRAEIFRQWLTANKIFFETICIVLLGSMAIIVSLVQLFLIGEQTTVFEKQANAAERQAVAADRATVAAEKQVQLAESQTRLTRASLSPRFVFEYQGSSPLMFHVANKGAPTRKLQGECVAYIEMDFPNVGKKRIELDGFYSSRNDSTLSSGNLHFFHHNLNQDHYLFWLRDFLAKYRFRHNIMHYVRLDYFNQAGEQRTEQYLVTLPKYDDHPVEKMPAMDAKVDLKQYLHKEKLDYQGANQAIFRAVESLSKND